MQPAQMSEAYNAAETQAFLMTTGSPRSSRPLPVGQCGHRPVYVGSECPRRKTGFIPDRTGTAGPYRPGQHHLGGNASIFDDDRLPAVIVPALTGVRNARTHANSDSFEEDMTGITAPPIRICAAGSVGKGVLPEETNPADLTDLVNPVADAASTQQLVNGLEVSFQAHAESEAAYSWSKGVPLPHVSGTP